MDKKATAPRDHPIHDHWRYGITGMSKVLDNVVVDIEQVTIIDLSLSMQSRKSNEVFKSTNCREMRRTYYCS